MKDTQVYTQETNSVEISVQPVYLDEQSLPEDSQFVWAYHIRIENRGERTLQLRKRYWRITDSLGRMHEVYGEGVVGEQPILKPGEAFEYTSGTPLSCPSGFMMGHYEMYDEEDNLYKVSIPAFSLDSPHHHASIN